MNERPPPAQHWPQERRRELLDGLRQALADTPGIRLAYAYGSFVGEGSFHDLDIAILLANPNDWRGIGRVAERVERTLGRVALPLDVVPLNDAPAGFRREVIRGGVLLWECAPSEALEYKVQTLSEYMDFEAHRRVQRGGA